jgi:hypothetical protein
MIEYETYATEKIPATLPNGNDGLKSYPNLLTEDELIKFLRIPQISKAKNYHNVIAHLKRYRSLPCIHLCRQPLYPVQAVLRWIEETTQKEIAR